MSHPDLSDGEVPEDLCFGVHVDGHVVELDQLEGHHLALLSTHEPR